MVKICRPQPTQRINQTVLVSRIFPPLPGHDSGIFYFQEAAFVQQRIF